MRDSGQTIYLGKILEFATLNSVSAPTLPFLLGYSYTLCYQPGASCVLPSACALLAGHPFLLTGPVNSITSRQLLLWGTFLHSHKRQISSLWPFHLQFKVNPFSKLVQSLPNFSSSFLQGCDSGRMNGEQRTREGHWLTFLYKMLVFSCDRRRSTHRYIIYRI